MQRVSCLRLENFRKLFPLHKSKHKIETRYGEKYQIFRSNGKRYANSSIPKMLQLLNRECKEQKQNLSKLKKQTLPVLGFIVEIMNLLLLF